MIYLSIFLGVLVFCCVAVILDLFSQVTKQNERVDRLLFEISDHLETIDELEEARSKARADAASLKKACDILNTEKSSLKALNEAYIAEANSSKEMSNFYKEQYNKATQLINKAKSFSESINEWTESNAKQEAITD